MLTLINLSLHLHHGTNLHHDPSILLPSDLLPAKQDIEFYLHPAISDPRWDLFIRLWQLISQSSVLKRIQASPLIPSPDWQYLWYLIHPIRFPTFQLTNAACRSWFYRSTSRVIRSNHSLIRQYPIESYKPKTERLIHQRTSNILLCHDYIFGLDVGTATAFSSTSQLPPLPSLARSNVPALSPQSLPLEFSKIRLDPALLTIVSRLSRSNQFQTSSQHFHLELCAHRRERCSRPPHGKLLVPFLTAVRCDDW